MLKKSIGYDNVKELRENIKKHIQSKFNIKKHEETKIEDFFEETIPIKSIDYYHTNSIARASRVMNECRKIEKNFLFTGIEKAN